MPKLRRVKVHVNFDKKEYWTGWFHGFFQHIDDDGLAYPMGLVEREDGSVDNVDIGLIQFTEDE